MSSVKAKYLFIASAIMSSVVAFNAYAAGGVALGATRVIYSQGDKQTSLPITNSSDKTVFLIQSWVADENGKKSPDFVVTPPLFSIQPKHENILRIMYVGGDLPNDRETVYYLNSKAIPSVSKDTLNKNSLQIATQSVIKLFMRPAALPTASVDAPKTLSCVSDGNSVTVKNPSPYYVTLAHFQVGSESINNTMVPPKGSKTVALTKGAVGSVIKFQTINDYGSLTPQQVCR